MVVGIANPNMIAPVAKMSIKNMGTSEKFTVLYNPESYTIQRSAKYSEASGVASNAPSIQFVYGTAETLSMELFFDSFSSGAEVGGDTADKAKFAANSLLASAAKMDVRDYTCKVYDLMIIDPSTHVPPLLKLEWSSLQFTGHLVECTQQFTKFSELGKPVRARLNVTFRQYMSPTEVAEMKPNESPDTTKYRTVRQGDSLWAFAAKEYGQARKWREIAAANDLDNPRLLDSGSTIVLPAL